MPEQDDNYCFFCGKVGPSAIPGVCDSPRCQQWDQEMQNDFAARYNKDLWDAWWAGLKGRCRDCDCSLRRITRWFYTLKMCICMMLELRYRGKNPYPDSITVGYFNQHEDSYGWSADWVEVGYGIFTGWWFRLEHDGECFM